MDRLTLRIENRSDAAGDMPEDISVQGKGISIGRKAENDWPLPDNTRFISGHHIAITFENDTYMLDDVSTNGTFVNGATQRVSAKHKLSDGDTIRIGSYIVGVVLQKVDAPILPQITGAQGIQAPPGAGATGRLTTGVQQVGTATGRGAQTPDFSHFQTGSKGATGVQRPGAVSMAPSAPAQVADIIPEDFGDDPLLETPVKTVQDTPPHVPEPALASKPSPAPPDATPAKDVMSAADPVLDPVSEKQDPLVSDPKPDSPPAPTRNPEGPFSMSDPVAAPVVLSKPLPDPVAKAVPVVEKAEATPRGLGERFADAPAPRATPETPAPAPAAPIEPAIPATNALLEGFLEGAGVNDAEALTIPLHELGVMLGRCARLGTQEMMQMLQDRAAVKLFVAQEDRTMRIASGNNPMKFMTDTDEAFNALFVQPRDGYQTGPDGFDNALNDIRQHQRAMMAAIQPALADMLEGLAPTEISDDVGGGGGVLGSGARKSWEEYIKRWESRAEQGENGMLDAFIDAFSRRYNQALDTL